MEPAEPGVVQWGCLWDISKRVQGQQLHPCEHGEPVVCIASCCKSRAFCVSCPCRETFSTSVFFCLCGWLPSGHGPGLRTGHCLMDLHPIKQSPRSPAPALGYLLLFFTQARRTSLLFFTQVRRTAVHPRVVLAARPVSVSD
jgi:hypothetical protein